MDTNCKLFEVKYSIKNPNGPSSANLQDLRMNVSALTGGQAMKIVQAQFPNASVYGAFPLS